MTAEEGKRKKDSHFFSVFFLHQKKENENIVFLKNGEMKQLHIEKVTKFIFVRVREKYEFLQLTKYLKSTERGIILIYLNFVKQLHMSKFYCLSDLCFSI